MSRKDPTPVSVNHLFTTVTSIQYEIKDQRVLATGFFFKTSDSLFLITAKHTICPFDPLEKSPHYLIKGTFPSSIRIQIRDQPPSKNVKPEYIELFTDEGKPRWYEHPNDPLIDIIAIPLDEDLLEYTGMNYLDDSNVFKGQADIVGGNRLNVLGYPFDILDKQFYLPVFRSALISSPYKLNFNKKTTILGRSR